MAIVDEQRIRLSVGKTLTNSVVSNVKTAGDTGILNDINTNLTDIKTAETAISTNVTSVKTSVAEVKTEVDTKAEEIKEAISDIDLSEVTDKVDAVKEDTESIKEVLGSGIHVDTTKIEKSLGEDAAGTTVHEKLDLMGDGLGEIIGTEEAYVTNKALGTKIDTATTTLSEKIDNIQVDIPTDYAKEEAVSDVYDLLDGVDTAVSKVGESIGNLQDRISETIGNNRDYSVQSHLTDQDSLTSSVKEIAQDNNSKLVSFATEVAKIGEPKSGAEYSTIFGAIEANAGGGGGSDEKLDTIIANENTLIYNRNNLGTLKLNIGVESVLDFLVQYITTGNSIINEIDDDVTTSVPYKLTTQSNSSIIKVRMSNVTMMTTNNGMFTNRWTALKFVDLPNCAYISTYQNFQTPTIQEVHLPKCYYIYTYQQFTNAANLILLEIGESMTTSFNINTWDPTNALLSDSTSLVYDGETFSSNLEKLLYNIRTYIADKLPISSGKTITLSANIKAAINADADTLAAFTDKGWTLA